jgi:hypothetical protein
MNTKKVLFSFLIIVVLVFGSKAYAQTENRTINPWVYGQLQKATQALGELGIDTSFEVIVDGGVGVVFTIHPTSNILLMQEILASSNIGTNFEVDNGCARKEFYVEKLEETYTLQKKLSERNIGFSTQTGGLIDGHKCSFSICIEEEFAITSVDESGESSSIYSNSNITSESMAVAN